MDLLSSDSEEEVRKPLSSNKRPVAADRNASSGSKASAGGADAKLSKIVVNQKFAKEFEKQQKLNDLQRSKDLSLRDDDESDDSDASSEDDEANLLSSKLQLDVINTINSIRKKDPKIYDKSVKFFNDDDDDDDDNSNSDSDIDSKKKKVTYKDVLRDQLLTHGAMEEGDGPSRRVGDTISTKKLAYDKEQETMRRAFINATKDSENSSDSDSQNADSDSGMLKLKSKNGDKGEIDKQLGRALHEMRSLATNSSSKGSTSGSHSSSASNNKSKALAANDNLDENAKDDFLSSYISSKKWKDSTFYSKSNDDDENDVSSSEDEAALDLAEKFENKYNFRFEELASKEASGVGGSIVGNNLSNVQVIGHSRATNGSLRRDDEKRKKERELRKDRKEKEKKQKEAELRRLKNLKRQELQDRLKKIADLGGLQDLGLDENALDEEWDPEKHEQMMQMQFGDEYYDANDDTFNKPVEDGNDAWMYEDDGEEEEEEAEEENLETNEYSKPTAKKLLSRKQRKQLKRQGVSMDDMDDVEGYLSARKDESAAAANMLDELYQLDYEDIIAGIPCRFKYKQVEAQDYGLSIDEIVAADDNDLNSLISLKHLATYNKKAIDTAKLSKKRKRLRAVLKDKVKEMNDLLEKQDADASAKESQDNNIDDVDSKVDAADGALKKKRRHKKKSNRDASANSNVDDDDNDDSDDKDVEKEVIKKTEVVITKADKSKNVPTLKASIPITTSSSTNNSKKVDASVETESKSQDKKKNRRHKKSGSGNQPSAKTDKRMDLYN